MSDLRSILAQAQRSRVAVVHEFNIRYKSHDPDIHIFVEGDYDETCYAPYVDAHISATGKLFWYRCGGRKAVVDAFHNAAPKLVAGRARVLFLMDKDLADFLKEQLPQASIAYVTPTYSFENWLFDREAVIATWRRVFHYDTSGGVDTWLERSWQTTVRAFSVRVAPIMAYAIFHRVMGRAISFNNIAIKRLISLAPNFVLVRRLKGGALYSHLDACAGVYTSANDLECIRALTRHLRSIEPDSWLRGKYKLWLFVKFMNTAQVEYVSAQKSGQVPNKVKLVLHEQNATALLAGNVSAHPSVTAFLQLNA